MVQIRIRAIISDKMEKKDRTKERFIFKNLCSDVLIFCITFHSAIKSRNDIEEKRKR